MDFIQLLRGRSRQSAARTAFLYKSGVAGDDDSVQTLRYGALEADADRIARGLIRRLGTETDATPGPRALLLFPPGLDFVRAFFGCLVARVLPVPTSPPQARRPMERTQAIVRDCRPAVVLTTAAVLENRERIETLTPALAQVPWMAVDELEHDSLARLPARTRSVAADDVAFLQYTSGSTGKPNGVRVTHGNLLHNSRELKRVLLHDEDSVLASWLPLHHDMGLIAIMLQTVFNRARCILLPPAAFLARPQVWLETMTAERVTSTGGPNFAFEHCLARISDDELATYDLASVKKIFNGAEPIRDGTMRAFLARFVACGLDPTSMHPGYGLAEATLVVSSPAQQRLPRTLAVDERALAAGTLLGSDGGKLLVGCGEVVDDTTVAIVDPTTHEVLADGRVGEIWIAGPSVGDGYWDENGARRASFDARTKDGAGPYLRTGDLGTFEGGELFVTGRTKDLVIVRGENHYPQDLETTLEACHPELRATGSAAFAFETERGEELGLVCELQRRRSNEPDRVVAAIRRSLADAHGIAPAVVVLIGPGLLPRTTSGKVRRSEARRRWQAGELDVVAERRFAADGPLLPPAPLVRDEPALAAWLAAAVAARAGLASAELAPDTTLAEAGLDSLATFDLFRHVEQELGTRLSLARLFEGASLATLARELARSTEPAPACATGDADDHSDGTRPLTAVERGLWAVQQAEPGSNAYNLSLTLRARTRIEPDWFVRSWNALVERTPALRTLVVRRADGEPRARVLPFATCDPAKPDATTPLARVLELADADELDAQLRTLREAPFDLGAGPPWRAAFVRTPDADRLVLVAHHVFCDHASLALLLEAWGAGATSATESAPSPPASEELREEDLAFWRDTLQPDIEALRPRDDRREPGTTGIVAERAWLDAELSRKLEAFARERGTTPFVVCLTVAQALLGRIAGQREFTLGTLSAGRGAGEAERVGCFVHPVALRARVEDDATWDELIVQTRQGLAAAFAHELPFATVVEATAPEREEGRTPYIDVLFTWQLAHRHGRDDLAAVALGLADAALTIDGQSFVTESPPALAAQFPVAIDMARGGDGRVRLAVELDAAHYAPHTARAWARWLVVWLEAALAGPETPLGALALGTPAERAHAAVYARGPELSQGGDWFADVMQRGERTPELVALVDDDGTLCYGTLRARVLGLASVLAHRGVGPGTRVGLCDPRGADFTTGWLALFALGATPVPLDRRWPRARQRDLCVAAGARLVLRCGDPSEALTDGAIAELALRTLLDATVEPFPWRSHVHDPADEAYLLFTSGSTGTPKGVRVPRRALEAHVRAVAEVFALAPGDRVLHMASVGFDLSLEELVPALAVGATVVARAQDTPPSAAELEEFVQRQGITVLDLPTAFAHVWAEALEAEERSVPSCVRLVILGGEAAHTALWRRFSLRAPHVRLLNTYGPTEATITSTVFEPATHAATEPWPAVLPLGRALAGWSAAVQDAAGHPAPMGVAGELVLGGAGLALGYLDDPEASAARFVTTNDGERLYRSGDRARLDRDGQLEFLGRDDDQVKIRGHRVEPGELEARLAARPELRSAAVVVERRGTTAALVAFVVPRGADFARTDFEAKLRAELPAFLVPRALHVVTELPRTSAGKLDRRALARRLVHDTAALATTSTQPQHPNASELEASLLALFRGLLNTDVGPDDDFFQSGGDSITALRLASQAATLGHELAPSDLVRARTPRGLATLLRARGTLDTPPVERGPEASGPVPLTSIQRWFFARHGARPKPWNQRLSFDVPAAFDLARARAFCANLVRRHDALRLVFQRTDGTWQAAVTPAATCAAPRVFAADAADAETQLAQAGAALDLEHGPLLVGVHIRGPHGNRLVLEAHHLAIDAVSWRIVLDELTHAATHGSLEERQAPPSWSARARTQAGLADPAREAPRNPHAATSIGERQANLIPGVRTDTAGEVTAPAQDAARPSDSDGTTTPGRTARAHRRGDAADAAASDTLVPEPRGRSSAGAAEQAELVLEVGETTRLLACARDELRAEPLELLAAALVAVAGTLPRDRSSGSAAATLAFVLERHGRDARDGLPAAHGIVGWFTELATARVTLEADATRARRLVLAKGALRAAALLGAEADAREAIALNFLGRLDEGDAHGSVRAVWNEARLIRSPAAPRDHVVEVDAFLSGGRLHVRLDVERGVGPGAEALAHALRAELLAWLEDDTAQSTLSPDDFPLAGLDAGGLADVLGRFGGGRG